MYVHDRLMKARHEDLLRAAARSRSSRVQQDGDQVSRAAGCTSQGNRPESRQARHNATGAAALLTHKLC